VITGETPEWIYGQYGIEWGWTMPSQTLAARLLWLQYTGTRTLSLLHSLWSTYILRLPLSLIVDYAFLNVYWW
jgi:hypothetical protein